MWLDLVVYIFAVNVLAGLIYVALGSLLSCCLRRRIGRLSEYEIAAEIGTAHLHHVLLDVVPRSARSVALNWYLLFFERSASAFNGVSLWMSSMLLAWDVAPLVAVRDLSLGTVWTRLLVGPWPKRGCKRFDQRTNALIKSQSRMCRILYSPVAWSTRNTPVAAVTVVGVVTLWMLLWVSKMHGTMFDGAASFVYQLALAVLLGFWIIQFWTTLVFLKKPRPSWKLFVICPFACHWRGFQSGSGNFCRDFYGRLMLRESCIIG